jgi:outer membrane protein assembly factor BamB
MNKPHSIARPASLIVMLLVQLAGVTLTTHPQDASGQSDSVYKWPQFRGGYRDNKAASSLTPPTQWSESENIRWKLPLELRGWSSPAVWGETAIVTEATPDGTAMFAISIDIERGKINWRKQIFENSDVEEAHIMNSYASPSAVTDGSHAWVHFGSYGTACLSLDTGDVIWQRRDLPCAHHRGPGSSPLLDDHGRLFIHYDGFDVQYIVALSAQTGETIWKRDRDIEYGTDNGDQMKAYSTPAIFRVGEQDQLISPTSKATIAYRPHNGEEIWRVLYDEFSATAQPLFDGKHVYVSTGFGKAHLLAIDPTGKGDVTDTHVLWDAAKGIGSKPTPLLIDGLIYNVHDAGVASCIDAETGEALWTERFGGLFSGSPLAAGQYIYWFDHDGSCYVTRQGREFELVAKNRLDDGCMATPVPLADSLLVRTRSALYRIGK